MTFEDFLRPMKFHFKSPQGWLHIADVASGIPAGWKLPLPFIRLEVPGNQSSQPENLSAPYRILTLKYEDMSAADNYRDLIVEANPVTAPDGSPGMIAVFFAEGAYEKIICYEGRMIHHYEPDQPDMGRRNHYGIFATWDLPLKGPCPFCKPKRR